MCIEWTLLPFCDMDQTFTILSVVYSAGHPFTVLIQIGQTFAPLPWDYGLYRKSRPKKQRSISRVEKRGPRLTRFYDYIYAITDYALRFVQTREETNFYYTEIRCELSTSGQQHRGMLQARRFKGHSTAAGTLCSSWRRSSMPLSLYANVPQTSTPSAQRVTQPWWGGRQGTPGKLRTSRVATPSIHAICS